MVDRSNEETYDIFIASSIYPATKSIFTRLQTLDEIKEDCLVVLDTNILLTPYTIGKEDLLDQCRKTYKPLSSENRLIAPGQVAREFAKHRAIKIAELYQQISRKQVPSMQKGKYPLLSSLEEYQELVRLEEEIDEKLDGYRQAYKKAVDRVKSHIQGWRWNDPVTLLYSEVFDENTVVDCPIDKETLQKDLEHRKFYKIPPGYKDGAKDASGIGDLLIWHTILEIGKTKKKSVIFVSGDEKADWFLRGEGGQALYPRYELVDEFKRHAEGQAFHIVKFSEVLELFGASKKIVKEVQHEEALVQRQGSLGRITNSWETEAVSSIINWLMDEYDPFEVRIEGNIAPGSPDLLLIDSNGTRAGIEVRIQKDSRAINGLISHLLFIAEGIKKKFHQAAMFIVYPDNINAENARQVIESQLSSALIHIPEDTSLVIGYMNGDEFEAVDSFGLLP